MKKGGKQIADRLWLDAQDRAKDAAATYMHKRSYDNDHILSGLIICPVCGRSLTGMVRTRKNKNGTTKAYGYYRCAHGKVMETGTRCNYAVNWVESQMNQQVEKVILDMVSDSDVKYYIIRKMTEEVNISTFEREKERLLGQLRQTEGAKTKLITMMENLDTGDRHYVRKSTDMQNRLNQMYDRITQIEVAVKEVDRKMQKVKEDHLNAQQLYMILSGYDRLYSRMTDAEKKVFFHNLVDHIELVPGETDVTRCIKSINLVFPIEKDGKEGDSIRFRENDTDETVLLIDSWKDQKALDAHHASAMMQQLAALREKYDLHMTVERYVSAEEPEGEDRFIRK